MRNLSNMMRGLTEQGSSLALTYADFYHEVLEPSLDIRQALWSCLPFSAPQHAARAKQR